MDNIRLNMRFKSFNQSKVKAFTLAEVLITLVIIGVVAALTIPSVVTSYKKHQTVTKLKKTYLTISQTINMAIKDHGPIKNWEIENAEPKPFVDKYVAPYLNVAKNCGYETTGDCEFKWTIIKKNNPQPHPSNRSRLILTDGVALVFESYVTMNNFEQYPYRQAGIIVYIDVNGQKAPNMYGKDIFIYTYNIDNDGSKNPGVANLTGKFMPREGHLTREKILSSCDKNQNGGSCAALIMMDGWQMKDYYPW